MSKKILIIHTKHSLSQVMRLAWDLVNEWIEGGPVVLEFSRLTKYRVQEEKYHAMLGDIARTVKMNGKHYELSVWKTLLVDGYEQELLGMGEGLRHPSKTVVSLDGMRAVTIRPSTTQFVVKEASGFIEYLYAFGTENEAVWSERALEIYNEYKGAT